MYMWVYFSSNIYEEVANYRLCIPFILKETATLFTLVVIQFLLFLLQWKKISNFICPLYYTFLPYFSYEDS